MYRSNVDNYASYNIQPGAEKVLSELKKNDNACWLDMLTTYYDKTALPKQLTVADIGGSSGRWILRSLLTMGIPLMVHVCEPEVDSLRQYQERVSALQARGQSISLRNNDNQQPFKLEDPAYHLPKSNLILCSHSLYYTAKIWKQIDFPLQNHLFTKLLAGLDIQGVLCVVLQSANPDLSPITSAINADLEDFIYPKLSSKNYSIHSHTNAYATAEIFELAIRQYAEWLELETGIKLAIHSQPSISVIKFDHINFTTLDPVTGKYQQSLEVTELFNFYTNMEYDVCNTKSDKMGLTAEQQKDFLNFIQHYCELPHQNKNANCSSSKQYGITHVNKIFMITLSDVLNSKLSYSFDN